MKQDISINRARLLTAVNGDWSAYVTTQQIIPWAAPPGCPNEPIVVTTTDFDLLRHDVHVLLHASQPPRKRSRPSRASSSPLETPPK